MRDWETLTTKMKDALHRLCIVDYTTSFKATAIHWKTAEVLEKAGFIGIDCVLPFDHAYRNCYLVERKRDKTA